MTSPVDAQKIIYVITVNQLVLNMAMPSGKPILFEGFTYKTEDVEEFKYFESEMKKGHPNITDCKACTPEELDPLYELKRKAVEEYKASLAGRTAIGSDDAAGVATSDSIKATKQDATGVAQVNQAAAAIAAAVKKA